MVNEGEPVTLLSVALSLAYLAHFQKMNETSLFYLVKCLSDNAKARGNLGVQEMQFIDETTAQIARNIDLSDARFYKMVDQLERLSREQEK